MRKSFAKCRNTDESMIEARAMVAAVLANRAFSRQPKNEKFNRQFK